MHKLTKVLRILAASLPLPMLGIAASYGVYTFGTFYLPHWVAIVMAASFEAVYIGLAAMQFNLDDRKRAQWISISAVITSVIHNVIAAVMHRRPEWFIDLAIWAEWVLAMIHAVPMPILAFCVANLVIHRQGYAHETSEIQQAKETTRADAFIKQLKEHAQNEPLDPRLVMSHELPRDEPRRETITLGSFPEQAEPKPAVSARVSHEPKPELYVIESPETLETLLDEPIQEQQRDFIAQLTLGADYPTSQLIELIGKSRAQSNRIISAAVEAGKIEQVQRGLYRRIA